MAAPIVSSLAGLIMSYVDDKAETIRIMEETADALTDSETFAQGLL